MISYFIELNEYKPQNRKCAEMAEFANQFGNTDRKSTRLNSSHSGQSRMPSSA